MKVSATKKQIYLDEAQQIATAPNSIIYLTERGVEAYSKGSITLSMLKAWRKRGQNGGPAYIQTSKASVVYLKQDIDDYLRQRRIEQNRDILAVLNQPTPEKVAELKEEIMQALFGVKADDLATQH